MRLAVEDNGVGFRVEEALARKDAFGLSGMRERVALLGGKFEIRSYPKDGTSNGTSYGTSSGNTSVDRKKTAGRGTKILIRLPVAKPLLESSSVEPIAAKPMGAKPLGAKPLGAKPLGVRSARRIRAVGA